MGKIVFAGAMSHVLDPDYYDAACGPVGRRKVEDVMGAIRQMGARLAARSPDALIVVADDHLNAFSFNAVPALCVRIGTTVSRMVQEDAEAFDKVLEDMPLTYPLHEELANQILEQGLASGFDLALSWEAPLDHAFLSPVTTLFGTRPIPPLVPIWVNCFVAPQPTARRCFDFGRHILHWLEHGEHEPLCRLGADELHKSGEHEFLNWMVLIGALTPARADVRYFGELGRINLAAVEWRAV